MNIGCRPPPIFPISTARNVHTMIFSAQCANFPCLEITFRHELATRKRICGLSVPEQSRSGHLQYESVFCARLAKLGDWPGLVAFEVHGTLSHAKFNKYVNGNIKLPANASVMRSRSAVCTGPSYVYMYVEKYDYETLFFQTRLAEKLKREEEERLCVLAEPLRHYLATHVLPILTEALIEVAKLRPEDPIDFLVSTLLLFVVFYIRWWQWKSARKSAKESDRECRKSICGVY